MTRQETGIIMDILTAAYPTFYAGRNAPDIRATLNLWAEMFADDDVRIVAAAVKALIASDNRGFPPVIGAVKDRVRRVTHPDELTEQEAWALVAKALGNSSYNAEEEFRKLPPVVRAVVHDPGQLREWAAMDRATVQSVVASNFQRSFRAKATAAREYDMLPEDVKALSQQLAAQFVLPEEAPPPKAIPQRAKEPTRDIVERAKREMRAAAPRSEYKPPSEADWNTMRNEAQRKLIESEGMR